MQYLLYLPTSLSRPSTHSRTFYNAISHWDRSQFINAFSSFANCNIVSRQKFADPEGINSRAVAAR